MEFKGTKGEWTRSNFDECRVTVNNGNIDVWSIDEDISEMECIANAELIAEAGNVRQQIDCSLTELLERYNEANKLIQSMMLSIAAHPDYIEEISGEFMDYVDLANEFLTKKS